MAVSQLTKKFIEFHHVEKMPIKEESYYENEDLFKEEIKYIGDELKSYVHRHNNFRGTKRNSIKIFANKKGKGKN